eukprot:6194046-Pleurochrysis_carterae.AAC.3
MLTASAPSMPSSKAERPRPSRGKTIISHIRRDKIRRVTFQKRKKGLVKKATELSVLCGSEIALIIFSPAGKLVMYSNKTVQEVYERCVNHKGPVEVLSNIDYPGGLPSAEAIGGSKVSDDEDERQAASSPGNCNHLSPSKF